MSDIYMALYHLPPFLHLNNMTCFCLRAARVFVPIHLCVDVYARISFPNCKTLCGPLYARNGSLSAAHTHTHQHFMHHDNALYV